MNRNRTWPFEAKCLFLRILPSFGQNTCVTRLSGIWMEGVGWGGGVRDDYFVKHSERLPTICGKRTRGILM